MTQREGPDTELPAAGPDPATAAFLHRLVHDLRGPSRSIRDLPTWLVGDLAETGAALSPEAERIMAMLAAEAARIDAVLDGLTGYLQAGEAGPVETILPRPVLGRVLAALSPPEDAEIEIAIEERALRIRRDDLTRLFAIPLSNALTYRSGPAPRIRLTAGRVPAGHWYCEIADDGPGLPEVAREAAFQPLRRLVPQDAAPGAGMGLATLRKIAARHRGQVEFLPPGDLPGALLRITLPGV